MVATRNANDLGGLLFRDVTPGDGYRVRLTATNETSGPLTVLTTQAAPPSTDAYNQTIPSEVTATSQPATAPSWPTRCIRRPT